MTDNKTIQEKPDFKRQAQGLINLFGLSNDFKHLSSDELVEALEYYHNFIVTPLNSELLKLQETIEWWKNQYVTKTDDHINACNIIERKEKELQSLRSTQQWISVKDERPPYYQNVLVFGGHTGTRVNVAWLVVDDNGDDIYTRLNSQGVMVNVTHWMPLPEPPKIGLVL